MQEKNIKNLLIATFSIRANGKRTAINGMIEPLLSYFLPKVDQLDLIDGYHPGSSDVISEIESYEKEKLKVKKIAFTSTLLYPFLYFQNNNATQTIFKVRDFLTVFEWGLRSGKKYDVFIGLESIYTFAGIILKKLGLVKAVIYYVSDYSPNRYPQKWFNNIYLFLDRFCAKNSDYIWDVSPAIQPARISVGLDCKKSTPVILVPNALEPKQINYLPVSSTIPFSLVFAGTLTKSNGPDIAVESMAIILKKFPKATLHIFGSNGADQARIKDLIQKHSLFDSVIFHGFVAKAVDLTRDIQKYSIGLAPYLDIPGSHRKYGDATKLRLYLGAGLPVITTAVPPLGKEVSSFGAAIITKDNAKEISNAVIKLFSDKKTYNNMRGRAIAFAKNNTWENTYANAFKQMRAKVTF